MQLRGEDFCAKITGAIQLAQVCGVITEVSFERSAEDPRIAREKCLACIEAIAGTWRLHSCAIRSAGGIAVWCKRTANVTLELTDIGGTGTGVLRAGQGLCASNSSTVHLQTVSIQHCLVAVGALGCSQVKLQRSTVKHVSYLLTIDEQADSLSLSLSMYLSLFLSLSLIHTHTHTHTLARYRRARQLRMWKKAPSPTSSSVCLYQATTPKVRSLSPTLVFSFFFVLFDACLLPDSKRDCSRATCSIYINIFTHVYTYILCIYILCVCVCVRARAATKHIHILCVCVRACVRARALVVAASLVARS